MSRAPAVERNTVGGSYYICPDEGRGGAWTFGPEQVAHTVQALWPQPQPVGPLRSDGVVDFDLRIGGLRCSISYFTDRRFFTFRDQEPLELPFRVVHGVLTVLAPGVPAVWTADFDGTMYPVDLSVGVEEFLSGVHA
ncbi:hypothetical protein ACFC1R_13325 [Kitasatospora sp. NPDC056138]|uniref:hypothetical protein n=1 Tax=Kitasatospora sp. NPDC056138 TaxID=3345724 RepID=UPI0035D93B6D